MRNRWSRTTRYSVIAVIAVLSAALLYYLRPLFGPLIVAALMAYVLNPIVDLVDRHTRLPRTLVVSATFVGVLAALAVVVLTFVPDLVGQFVDSLDELASVERDIANRTGIDLQFTGALIDLQSRVTLWLGNVTNVVTLFQTFSANLLWTMVSLVAAFYLLLDWAKLRDWMIALAPRAARSDLVHLYGEVRRVWKRYLRGQLSLMFIVGALSGVGGAVVGLPGAAALGLAAGILDIIPTFGPLIAMVIATIIAWLAGSLFLGISNSAFALVVLSIYALVQLIENLWLRPRIMGSSVRLHPAVVFIAFFSALSLSGVVLAVLIVPLVGTSMIIGRYIRGRLFGVDPFEVVHTSGVDVPGGVVEQGGAAENVVENGGAGAVGGSAVEREAGVGEQGA